MSTNFTWSITLLETKQQEGQYTDVVVTASWYCVGVENGTGFTCNSAGSSTFTAPTGSFTPYSQLTQDQVLGWCYSSGVNKAAVEAGIQAQITAAANPPIVNLPLPW
jgi:hypothetical protein